MLRYLTLMMLDVPVRGVWGIRMQLYACFKYVDGLLPVEVIVADEGDLASLEIMKPVLMVITVTASLLVQVPIFVNSLTSSA